MGTNDMIMHWNDTVLETNTARMGGELDKRIGDNTIGYKKVGWFMMTMKGRKLKKQVKHPRL